MHVKNNILKSRNANKYKQRWVWKIYMGKGRGEQKNDWYLFIVDLNNSNFKIIISFY